MFRRRPKKVILVIVVLLVLAAVLFLLQQQGNPLPKDESILSQTPCEFPCWHGITPSKSTLSEAQQLVQEDPFITSSGNLQKGTDGSGRTVFRWLYGRSQEQNRILVEEENVYSIEIVPNLVFTLGDIINHYGFPSAIHARLESANEGGTVDALLFIYYPNLGAEIEFRIEGGDVLAVDQFNVTSDLDC